MIKTALNKSTSFHSMMQNLVSHFQEKFETVTDENAIDFAKEMSKLKDIMYDYYEYAPDWIVGNYRDMFEVTPSEQKEEAQFLLKDLEEQYTFNTHLLGSEYILSEEEQEEIEGLKALIKNQKDCPHFKMMYITQILKSFYQVYDPRVVAPLVIDAWSGRTKVNDNISKEAAKKLIYSYTSQFAKKPELNPNKPRI